MDRDDADAMGSSKKTVISKLFKVRKRREMLFVQVCFICSVLFVAWSMSALLTKTGHGMIVDGQTNLDPWGRRLMASEPLSLIEQKNCSEPAIHEFPEDFFSNNERKSGAVLLHIVATLYMFLALAITCDEYFVTSLEKICEVRAPLVVSFIFQFSRNTMLVCLHNPRLFVSFFVFFLCLQKLDLSEDVAGATFMAAGSSAPELFASVIGVFITHGDVGVGTIVGSAVFNILCIIGVCGIFAGQVVMLTKWAVFRDSFYYILSVLALIAFIYDEKIVWWESLVLVLMYAGYILVMKFNSSMQRFFMGKSKKNVANGNAAASSEMEDVKPSNPYSRGSVVMVDEIMHASPSKFRFPEAGLRVMVTSHFGPKTRLRMASRLIITERQKLVQAANGVETQVIDGKVEIENGNVPEDKPAEPKENITISPFHVPNGIGSKLKWLISWPLLLLLFLTVPNCAKPRWEKYFMLSFILSTVWIAVFSYFMVWMVTIVGYTLGIPDVIMGITFLAAGTSVPDCIASLIVARQGLGDMAVSNTIGSNVFDILVGLGVPWAIQTMCVDYGSAVMINSRGLLYSVVLLLGSVALTVLGIHLNKWRLDLKLGIYVLILYAIFLCFSILIEYNVFTFVNLPMCFED
ncbi:putative sodium/potassium/calcium exchanger 4-like [Scophthalmus maximus]|uniref:Putative sodium/potassium/calcium exchanger 4-like n=1 Tax=Scophthalmus maximus TaxID=52904 RepID=A0A2U9CUL7_SCOMX|nr:putative sodium/potassium/calcium exchanger 4-like [Scophthalmus maximus]